MAQRPGCDTAERGAYVHLHRGLELPLPPLPPLLAHTSETLRGGALLDKTMALETTQQATVDSQYIQWSPGCPHTLNSGITYILSRWPGDFITALCEQQYKSQSDSCSRSSFKDRWAGSVANHRLCNSPYSSGGGDVFL